MSKIVKELCYFGLNFYLLQLAHYSHTHGQPASALPVVASRQDRTTGGRQDDSPSRQPPYRHRPPRAPRSRPAAHSQPPPPSAQLPSRRLAARSALQEIRNRPTGAQAPAVPVRLSIES